MKKSTAKRPDYTFFCNLSVEVAAQKYFLKVFIQNRGFSGKYLL